MRLFRVLSLSIALLAVPSCVGDDDEEKPGGDSCYYLAEWQECHCESGPNGVLCEFCYPCVRCSQRQGSSCVHGGEVSACLSECPDVR